MVLVTAARCVPAGRRRLEAFERVLAVRGPRAIPSARMRSNRLGWTWTPMRPAGARQCVGANRPWDLRKLEIWVGVIEKGHRSSSLGGLADFSGRTR